MIQLVMSSLSYPPRLLQLRPSRSPAVNVPLQRVQNAAVRLILGFSRRSHITPALKRLTSWLPIKFRVIFGRPFVKRFALCYRTVVLSVCPVCLSVCNVRALWPNGWTDQDETWHAGMPRPWPHCVRGGRPSSTSPKGAEPPIFGPYLLWPNGCMDQVATSYGARPQPRGLCVTWGPSPLPKRGQSPLPNFRPISIVAKRLDASRCHLVWR